MSLLNEDPLILQEMLTAYRCGLRGLPTYTELLLIDNQIGSQLAQIASLRDTLRTVIQEQQVIAQNYFLMTRTKP